MKTTSEVMVMTPQRAMELLDATKDSDEIKNRNLSQSRVETYARQMREGKWDFNGESVILDEAGNILDGQHRLWACVESNISFKTVLVTGVERAAFKSIDTGKGRGASDVLSIAGLPGAGTNLAAACGLLYLYEQKKMIMVGNTASAGFTNAKCLDIAKRHPGLSESVEWCHKNYKSALTLTPSAAGFLHYVFSKYDAAKADTFFLRVADIEPDSQDSVTRLLRRTMMASLRVGKSISKRAELLAIHVKAWSAFVEGRTMKQLKWVRRGPSCEDFPVFPGDKETRGVALVTHYEYTPQDSIDFILDQVQEGPKDIAETLATLQRRGMPYPWRKGEVLKKYGLKIVGNGVKRLYALNGTEK